MRCRLWMAASSDCFALREPPDMVPDGLKTSPSYDTERWRMCLSKVTCLAELPSYANHDDTSGGVCYVRHAGE